MSTNPVLRKKGATGVRTWLALDSTGQTQVVEAGKYSIMRRTGLPGRDLRVLDPLLSYPSTVLGRERAIVVNLEHVKAIVMAKEVLLLNSMDPFVSPFVEELRRRILGHHRASKTQEGNVDDSNNRVLFETEEKQSNVTLNRRGKRGSSQLQDEDESMINKAEAKHALKQQDGYQILPFEFVALEACLEAACSSLENEAKGLELEAYPALDKLTSQISTLNLERVRQMKSRLVAITGRVQKVRDELEHLLDDDNDMAEMHLSDKLLQNNLEEEDSSTSNDEDDDDMHDETADADNRIVPPEIVMEIQRGSSASKENNNGNDGSVLDRVYSARNTLSRDSHIGSSRRSNPIKHKVAELEMLLEAYFVQIDGTSNKLSTLREYVDDTEDYINIMLDDKQNQLLQMGVMLTTATMVSTIFIVVTGLLGMNIRIALFLTDTPTGMPRWLWTTGAGCTGIVILYVMAIAWYKYKGYID